MGSAKLVERRLGKVTKKPKPRPPAGFHKTETALDFDKEIEFLKELDAHAERKCDPKTCVFCKPRTDK